MHSFTYQTGQSGVRNSHPVTVKYFLILIALFLCTPAVHVYAQKNARPATVFFGDGHTEKGLIDYRNWESSPVSFIFKGEKGSGFQKLDTATVSAFEIDDQSLNVRFEKHTLAVEVSNMDHNGVYAHRTPEYAQRTLFIRCLVKGRNTLFALYRGNKITYYLSINDSSPFELVNRKFNENKRVIEDKSFRAQLIDSLICSEKPAMESVVYRQKDLMLIVEKCNGENQFTQRSARPRSHFGIVAGPAISQITYIEDVPRNPTRLPLKAEATFSAGLYIDLPLSQNVKKFTFYGEVNYTSYNGQNAFEDEDIYQKDYYARFGYIHAVTLARYYFPSGKFFLNAGLSQGFLVSSEQTKRVDGGLLTENIYEELRNFKYGGVFGAGYMMGHWSVAARYERSSGNSPYTLRGNTFHHGALLLGYAFH